MLLPALVRRPEAVFPILFERAGIAEILTFSACSGIYVAYAAAQAFNVSDDVGFWIAALGIVPVGAALGFIALFFAGGLLTWSADRLRGGESNNRMFAVFGYSTWPFLPLLLVIVPIEAALYGTAIFSAARPDAGAAVWLLRLLEAGVILLWLFLMVKGTRVAAHMSNERAAETVALSLIEIGVIVVLFLLILLVSLLYW